jgi:hypothetical protein
MAPRRATRWLVGALAVLAVAGVARATLGISRGLQADYYTSLDAGGQPARTLVSPRISTSQIAADWSGAQPAAFRARWYGYLTVLRPGVYTFSTTSDDGSSVTIDGQLVVDNGGIRGTTTRTGQIRLARGLHPVSIEYLQAGGFYEMRWAWGRDREPPADVPSWVLSPTRTALWRVVAARTADWVLAAAVVLVVGLAGWLGFGPGGSALAATQRRPKTASLVFFATLAIVQTWPLARDPGRLSRNDNGDTVLNEWTLAWVAHQAPRAPLRLYDANIFFPERQTLAYSEAMIVQSAMGAPLLWLGASPVLVYNLLLLAGFALTGWTTSLVVARWTGDWMAAMVSGTLAGVNAHTLTRIPHLQAQHAEFLPLALLALDAVLREPRTGHAVRLALWFTLQALTSVYLLVFTAFGLAAAALARPEHWWGRRFLPVAGRIALAATLAALALLPFLLPYWRVYAGQGMARSLDDALQYSASLADYLTTPGRVHFELWSHRWTSGTALFPGVTALALTAIACGAGVAFRDPRARMCLALGVCGVALSFGPRLPGYDTLYHLVPLLHAVRAPVRFGYLGIVATALLAGFGVTALRRRLPDRVFRPLGIVLVLLAVVEPFSAPLGLTRFDGIPAIYSSLRSVPDAVVVELPLPPPHAVFHNARYLLHSTRHWKPMLNGYSGFVPASYRAHFERLSSFPSDESVAALASLHVTHAFVHRDQIDADAADRLSRTAGLEPLASEGAIALYRVVGR